jgi:mRNA interferase RelE/StbE
VAEYQVQFIDEADRAFRRLDRVTSRRIWKRRDWLKRNFDDFAPELLTGNLAGLYKLRVGDYLVIYELIRSEHTILVQFVGHRRDVYRR